MYRTHPIVLALLLPIFGFCQFSANYGFVAVAPGTGSVDPGTPPSIEGVIFGNFSAHGVTSEPSASGRFAFTNWPLGAVNGSNDLSEFTGDLSGLCYYEVTIKPLAGYTLQLNNIYFHVRRSGSGIRNYSVRSSLDNYTGNLSASTGTNSNLAVIPSDVFFWRFDSTGTSSDQKGNVVTMGSLFSDIRDSVIFRFYAWNAETAGGSFSIDNVSFTGKVTDSLSVYTALQNDETKEPSRAYFKSANNTLNIENCLNCRFELYDLHTILIETGTIQNVQVSIDLSLKPRGMYLVLIAEEKKLRVTKFIKPE